MSTAGSLADFHTAWRAWRLIGQAHRAIARGEADRAAVLLDQAGAAAARLRASLTARGAL